MKITQYIINAFATNLHQGNPAAVCLLEEYPSDSIMQQLATKK